MKKYPIRFLSFLIFVGFLFVGLPLHPIKAALTVNYLTDQDGLPNYTVYKIFKDSRNMMWIGTFNGICRFDGHSFTKFHIDLPKPLNAVTDIVETHEGQNGDIEEYKNVYVWKYKVINGNLYKRKYNRVTGEWVGKWTRV